jgi:MSHA pilin protein MshA
MQKQQGFTLIELVVVIIILGILAVTAAPKFINLQGDARASALAGVKGAIQGANTLVYSKAALAGLEKSTSATLVDIAGTAPAAGATAAEITAAQADDVSTIYGYLDATTTNFSRALDISVQVITAPTTGNVTSTGDWGIAVDAGVVSFWQNGAPVACTFTYKPATATSIPVYSAMPAASAC